ncbi:MAG TPA: ATP-binding protein [Bryobacteraceae bacterium]|nr:ATP-binding protein [Bryobacteraceae bacterium]
MAWQLDTVSRELLTAPKRSKARLDQVLIEVDHCLKEARPPVSALRQSAPPVDLASSWTRWGDNSPDLWMFGSISPLTACPGRSHRPARRRRRSRFVLEALRNAVHHAHAQTIAVTVSFRATDWEVEVRDDGVGFEPHRLPGGAEQHWGLVGMQERALRAGGLCCMTARLGAVRASC